MSRLRFGLTFLIAWLALDRLATAPPAPGRSLLALAIAVLVVADLRGLARPPLRTCLIALVAGALVVTGYLGGAALLGVSLHLRPDWPLVLAGVLIFHGLAEEFVWRGLAFRWLRERHSFGRAVAWSMPLIAVTHVPLLFGAPWFVAVLGIVTAAVTCVPLAWLWEHGNRTIWAPAIVHAAIGMWQLWERDYPPTFSLVVVGSSIVLPLLVLLVPLSPTGSARAARPASLR
ncbi:CPBP family intramembrane metalloprotease [Actinoplanes bogorensis]|uniref:CPBP family intramembrane metalloprotease n=1 Tax=Paractinoplanes bogorensis TaxID=1610840 RepID=A0ABS5YU27_9ACTN|nr:CPBP family intramembrane glutamic endopeptidase [Actinoplanes bogorensis]MBU2666198.1 CPBP family intramembrane metalloprotease [Actinoplanes bogorensis]